MANLKVKHIPSGKLYKMTHALENNNVKFTGKGGLSKSHRAAATKALRKAGRRDYELESEKN